MCHSVRRFGCIISCGCYRPLTARPALLTPAFGGGATGGLPDTARPLAPGAGGGALAACCDEARAGLAPDAPGTAPAPPPMGDTKCGGLMPPVALDALGLTLFCASCGESMAKFCAGDIMPGDIMACCDGSLFQNSCSQSPSSFSTLACPPFRFAGLFMSGFAADMCCCCWCCCCACAWGCR